MNSTEKVRNFVRKVIEVTNEQAFTELMELLRILTCYIEDIENRKDPKYNILFSFFGEAMSYPRSLRYKIAYYCDDELWQHKHNFFRTFKLCYVKMLLDDPDTPNYSSNGINKKKIKAVKKMLKKADFNDDTCLFEAAKDINNLLKH